MVSKISNRNIMVKVVKFPNRGSKKLKNFKVREGGVSELGNSPKLYLVINYDGFPYYFRSNEHHTSIQLYDSI